MNRKLIIFTLLTFAVSWACWLPIIAELEASPFESPLAVLGLFFLGAYAPTLMGLVFTYYYQRGEGLKALLKNGLVPNGGKRWVLFSLVAAPSLYAASIGLYASFGGSLGAVNYGLLPWLPIVFTVPLVFGPLAEEFGWRGFALPLLDYKNKVLLSSIIIGLIWAAWHAPLFWAETGTAISGLPISPYNIGLFFMAVIGSSFIYTWLFNRTSGSVFAAIMLHWSMNASGTITGMLFPELDLEQRLALYEWYVLALWAIVIVAWVAGYMRRKSTTGRALGKPQLEN